MYLGKRENSELIKLNDNERKTLNLIIQNAKFSDTQIAKKLKITSQAVGKIRKRLEKIVISGYSVDVDYSVLGINLFAAGLFELTEKGKDFGKLETENILLSNPNVVSICRLPKGNVTYFISFGFRDMNELDNFFQSPDTRELHKLIDTRDLFTYSYNGILKNSSVELMFKMLRELDQDKSNLKFDELERFKKKLTR